MPEQIRSTTAPAPSYLWYVPNQTEPGHRGDEVRHDHNSLEVLTEHALATEKHGWDGALLGAGWHRPDTMTVAAALAARTTAFQPLAAVRPGYWQPAHLAATAATLDHLSGGRLLLNVVSGTDAVAEYGDPVRDRADRYARTLEFLQVLRRLWTEPEVTHHGRFYTLEGATLGPRPVAREGRAHPPLYFGGASPEAERVAASSADVQLFWGEPLAAIAERISRLRSLSREVGRELPPLEFGLRVTVLARADGDRAWAEAEDRLGRMSTPSTAAGWVDGHDGSRHGATGSPTEESVGQSRLDALSRTAPVLDGALFTAPAGRGGRGAGSSWLVGSYQDVADALTAYRDLGITHFILSDTPYLEQAEHLGRELLPLLRTDSPVP